MTATDSPEPMPELIQRLQRAVFEYPLSADYCFLCAVPLDLANRIQEHVIPKWVQRRFDLWNETVTLLNGAGMKYWDMVIPCCKECNGTWLSRMENKVRTAVDAGADAVRALPKMVLFQWLVKIFIGLLYKELISRGDRRDPDSPPILAPDALRHHQLLHLFLQTVWLDNRHETPDEACPSSIFILDTQRPATVRERFDLMDNFHGPTLAIRLGGVGIVAHFLEGGAHAANLPAAMVHVGSLTLHPVQFREYAARVFYGASLLQLSVRGKLVGTADGSLALLLRYIQREARLFRDVDPDAYAERLAYYWGVPVNHVKYSDGRRVRSFLFDEDCNPRAMPPDAQVAIPPLE
jgi:hypothetical protein